MRSKSLVILLAAYNGQKWLQTQIDSILYTRCEVDLELSLSVDVSNDATLEICNRYATIDTRVSILPYGDRYGGAGKNFYRLLKDTDLICYDYIAFCDQDDIWHENKLPRAIEKLQQYDCYSSNVTAFWEDGREVLIDKAQPQRKWDFLFEAAGPGCTYVFKREVAIDFKAWLLERYQQVGEDIALHDWLLYAFARCRGYSWYIDPEPMMRYRQHANNQVGTNNSLAAAQKRLKLIKNKWYRNQVVKIIEHLGLQETPIFKRGINNGYLGNLFLLLNVDKLRRRLRDRIALALVLVLNIF
ncbi:glycosyltransferase [Aeromonas sp. Y311-2]|uniref:glycosyltransferase n=1 Tax=Aeromonas sp. Y311-2 TaxID=2990507 RepID=UPI0022E62578|nr:glycosyltransferase [Aeromonas sp. Y311-2]